MRLLHIADLHIGKRLNEISLLEDQRHILFRIYSIIERERPDAVLIAGDVYDKALPPAEAVELLDDFLTAVTQLQVPCFVISGNHDAAERIAYGARIMKGQGLYMSQVFNGSLDPILLQDDLGPVAFYMLPFVKPAHVRRFFPDEEIETYEDAVRIVLQHAKIDSGRRNVLLAHQFVAGVGAEPERSDSESDPVGGLDRIDNQVFQAFDYVALGHLHRPQSVGDHRIRYAGSPLKYSFSEANHEKSATMATLGAKGSVSVETILLKPRHDMRVIRGPLLSLIAPETYKETDVEDYLHVVLTDEEEIMDAMGHLRTVFPNVMRLEFDNARTAAIRTGGAAEDVEDKTLMEHFGEFYQLQNNVELDPSQVKTVSDLLDQLGGEGI